MSDQADIIAPSAVHAPVAKPAVDWWGEIKGVFWLVLAVLGFHSFLAKPFYIPSESMMPGLLVGDRLVVTKYPYGWSFVSPTFHLLPFMPGRLFGSMPERGDVVIASPPGVKQDYIKRVIGLPGDRIELRGGIVILNWVPVKRAPMRQELIRVDANAPCSDPGYFGLRVTKAGGQQFCQMPIVRETLPNGRNYDTVDLRNDSQGDDFGPLTIAEGHVFLMGDNRDNSSDSRFGREQGGLGGAVPWENIGGRAEFITFSLDGSTQFTNPLTWFSALRPGRAGSSLHPQEAQ